LEGGVYNTVNKNKLPSWLTATSYAKLPIIQSSWHRRDYLEKTLDNISQIMAEDMYQDGVANCSRVLQMIHPIIKIIGCTALLILSALSHSFLFLFCIHLLTVAMLLMSGINILDYIKRVWIPAFVFSGIMVLPAISSWITPGDELLVIYQSWHWYIGGFSLPEKMIITKQGVRVASFVLMRTATSLAIMVALVKTTQWNILTKSLGKLGVPSVFVMVLDLTYRYLFLFLLLLSDFIFGRKSRLVGKEGPLSQWEWIGGAVGGFFRMSLEYSGEVSAAMIARGYSGENKQRLDKSIRLLDLCFLCVILGLCILSGML